MLTILISFLNYIWEIGAVHEYYYNPWVYVWLYSRRELCPACFEEPIVISLMLCSYIQRLMLELCFNSQHKSK